LKSWYTPTSGGGAVSRSPQRVRLLQRAVARDLARARPASATYRETIFSRDWPEERMFARVLSRIDAAAPTMAIMIRNTTIMEKPAWVLARRGRRERRRSMRGFLPGPGRARTRPTPGGKGL